MQDIPEQLQVFISSVMGAEDLSRERSAVRGAIGSLKLTRPWAFEFSPAQADPAARVYLEEVRRSDLLVCIVSHTHSAAVQAELAAAEDAGVRILAFVRRVQPEFTQNSDRLEVIQWLSKRVKYEIFEKAEDLATRVITALALELVRGYRQYRMGREDLRTLVETAPSPRGLLVRPATADERAELREVLLDLVQWYPHIGVWIEKVLAETGTTSDVRVADLRGEIAGLAISRDKEAGVRKYSTIYVRPGFQGEAIGPHLIYDEVKKSARENVRKAYVTFADELRSSIGPILQRYGFYYEGVSTSRYRVGSAEWVMGKTFSHQSVDVTNFDGFVEEHWLRETGGRVLGREGRVLKVRLPDEPLLGNVESPELNLVYSVSQFPEADYTEWAERLSGERWLFLSIYGKPADLAHWSHQASNWLDGEDLSARYFPVRFVLPEQPSLICTIQRSYADGLIPSSERPQLLGPSRLQVRPDNVFYRRPDRYNQLRRGSRIFFYVSAPESALRGFGRLQGLRLASPEECASEFGTMGILSFEALETIAQAKGANGRVLALVFDWYIEYANKLKLDKVKERIPNFNPVGANIVSFEKAEALVSFNEQST
jgi:hypothetical protein